MHVSLPIGDSVLMGSDVPSMFGPPPVMGSNFSITYTPQSREEVDALLAKLSDGGNVTMEAQDDVLGLLLCRLHRQVRHRLDARLRAD